MESPSSQSKSSSQTIQIPSPVQANSQELIKRGFSGRGNHNLPDDVVNDPKYVLKAIGTTGTTLLCNTELCLHRAGIPAPNHSRDIVEFKFITSNKPFSENWMEHLDVDELEERMSGKE